MTRMYSINMFEERYSEYLSARMWASEATLERALIAIETAEDLSEAKKIAKQIRKECAE